MSSESPTNIKNAASLLIRGGTLTGEPCEKCGGPLIRFEGKTTCISCGAEKKLQAQQDALKEPAREAPQPSSDLRSCVGIVEQKILRLASDISGENDIGMQKQKAELMESYLRILEKLKSLVA